MCELINRLANRTAGCLVGREEFPDRITEGRGIGPTGFQPRAYSSPRV